MTSSSLDIRTGWPRGRRAILVFGGAVLGALALVFGLTDIAQGALPERGGTIVCVSALMLAVLGFYVAVAGLWGGWSPSDAARLRTLRALMFWIAIVSVVLSMGLPLLSPGTMLPGQWLTLGVLAAYALIAIAGITAVVRHPRVVIVLVGVAAAYALLSVGAVSRMIVTGDVARFAGPSAALSLLLAGSVDVAILAAFFLARPLWYAPAPN